MMLRREMTGVMFESYQRLDSIANNLYRTGAPAAVRARIVRHRYGPVSCSVMRLSVRFTLLTAVLAALTLLPARPVAAQSSSSQPGQTATTPSSSNQGPIVNGGYVAINPLAGVNYNNKYDLSLGMAYDHMKAGPTLVQGAHLGGLNLTATRWFSKHWGVEGSGRAYIGTSGAGVNDLNLKGPMVKQYFFVGGAEYLGPHNQHGAILAHLLVGGVYGDFQKDLLGYPPAKFAFYYNQVAPAAIIGGHFDLNRSAHWVFRITPDAVMTHYTYSNSPYSSQQFGQFDVNFAISVGMEYKFKGKR